MKRFALFSQLRITVQLVAAAFERLRIRAKQLKNNNKATITDFSSARNITEHLLHVSVFDALAVSTLY